MLHLDNFILFIRSVLGLDKLDDVSHKAVLIPIKVQQDDMSMRDNVSARCADARRRMYDNDY